METNCAAEPSTTGVSCTISKARLRRPVPRSAREAVRELALARRQDADPEALPLVQHVAHLGAAVDRDQHQRAAASETDMNAFAVMPWI